MSSDWEFLLRTSYGSEVWIRQEGDKTFIREVQYLDDYLDQNVAKANAGFDRKAELWPAASVPLSLIQQWRTEGLDYFDPNNSKIVNRMLDSSDYSKLRVGAFRIGKPGAQV